MERTDRREPPSGVSRLLFRLPVHLYRLRLGWLFGNRLMLLVHTGRVSGRQHRTVVEVVGHDPVSGEYTVCSGFGTRADWYRNVLAVPEVVIEVGGRRRKVTAVPLSASEGAQVLARYARRYPAVARRLLRFMGFVVDGSQEDYRAVGRELPCIRFTPRV